MWKKLFRISCMKQQALGDVSRRIQRDGCLYPTWTVSSKHALVYKWALWAGEAG